jgi:cytochrome c biogenesis factor
MQSLILLLLLEGCFIGAAGGFMYIGLGAVRAAREATRSPAVTEKQKKVWKERQESRDQWSFAMITAGLLMILVGFVMSTIFQI